MNSYANHQVDCDLCDESFDYRLDGTTTECGLIVCQACCDEGLVTFHHTEDDCYAYLVE